MKKIFAQVCFLFFGGFLVAQTPRMCLYEVFNGENNAPSNPTNLYLNPLLALPTNTPKVCVLNWEVPIPSAPTATWSLYQTNQAENNYRFRPLANGGYGYVSQNPTSTLVVQGINGAPYGLMDGQQPWVFGANSSHPLTLTSSVIATAQSYTSAFSISMARTWNIGATAVELTVSVVASANFTAAGPLVFRTVMVEKNINFTSPPGTNGETSFQNVAIRSFPTLSAGISMAPTWTVGQSQTFTLSCAVPSYARDKSEIDMIGFIQDDGTKKVAQAMRTGTDPLINDAKAVSSSVNPIYCQQGLVSPTVVVKNTGLNIINAFTITPFVNAQAATNYQWSGTLTPNTSVTLALPPFASAALINGTNTFSYSIIFVNGGDLNFANNSWSSIFSGQTNLVPLSLDITNLNLCQGRSFSLSASGSGAISLQPGSLAGPSFNLNPLTSTIYTVTANVGAGCTQNVATCSVTVVPNPTIAASGGSVCASSNFTIVPSGALNYTLFPAGTVSSSFVVTPSANNIYIIVGADANGCSDTTTAFVSVIQNALQNLGILGNVIICKGESTQLQSIGAVTYTWSNGSSTSTQVLSPQSTTVITVTGSDQNNCKKTVQASIQVNECLAIEEVEKQQHLQVHPNPAHTYFEIQSSHSGVLIVVNASGQEILKQTVVAGYTQINCAAFSPGIYYVMIAELRQKLVIE